MATIVKIDRANQMGSEILRGMQQIREGLGTLRRIDGMRAQAIAVSAAELEALFGVEAGGGQALSDRLAAFWDFYDTQWGETGYEYAAKLRDLVDATFPL